MLMLMKSSRCEQRRPLLLTVRGVFGAFSDGTDAGRVFLVFRVLRVLGGLPIWPRGSVTLSQRRALNRLRAQGIGERGVKRVRALIQQSGARINPLQIGLGKHTHTRGLRGYEHR